MRHGTCDTVIKTSVALHLGSSLWKLHIRMVIKVPNSGPELVRKS